MIFFFHTCNICGIKFHYMNQHGLCVQRPKFHEYQDQLNKFSPLPSIEKVFKELVQEVTFTSLTILASRPCNTILATSSLDLPLASAVCENEHYDCFGPRRSNSKCDHSHFYTFCRIRGHFIEYCQKHARVTQSSASMASINSIPLHPPTPSPNTSSFGKSSNSCLH